MLLLELALLVSGTTCDVEDAGDVFVRYCRTAPLDTFEEFAPTGGDIFLASRNDKSWVEVKEKSGARVWKTPSPPLSQLRILPDQQLVVGFSSFISLTRYHIVVWDFDGQLLLARPAATAAWLSDSAWESYQKKCPYNAARIEFFGDIGRLGNGLRVWQTASAIPKVVAKGLEPLKRVAPGFEARQECEQELVRIAGAKMLMLPPSSRHGHSSPDWWSGEAGSLFVGGASGGPRFLFVRHRSGEWLSFELQGPVQPKIWDPERENERYPKSREE